MTEFVQTIRPSLPYQEPSRCARTHLEQKPPCLIFQTVMSAF